MDVKQNTTSDRKDTIITVNSDNDDKFVDAIACKPESSEMITQFKYSLLYTVNENSESSEIEMHHLLQLIVLEKYCRRGYGVVESITKI